MIPTLSDADVAKVLKYEELIPAMEKALSAFSAGRAIQPVRNMLTIEEGKRFLGIMPAVTEDGMGAKLVCFFPKNAGSQVPTHLAMIMLFEPETGQPLAFLDGRRITEMRTAATSAAVTKHLAPPNSRVLALLGSGVQALAHLQALRHVCQFDEVRVWSQTPDRAQRFAARHGAKAMDLESAVRGADVLVTATNALEPFLKGEWLKQGAHVNAVGSPRPTWRELDDVAMNNTLIVDSREARAQGIRRRDIVQSPNLCRGRRSLRRAQDATTFCNQRIQISRDRRGRHRGGTAGLRCHCSNRHQDKIAGAAASRPTPSAPACRSCRRCRAG